VASTKAVRIPEFSGVLAQRGKFWSSDPKDGIECVEALAQHYHVSLNVSILNPKTLTKFLDPSKALEEQVADWRTLLERSIWRRNTRERLLSSARGPARNYGGRRTKDFRQNLERCGAPTCRTCKRIVSLRRPEFTTAACASRGSRAFPEVKVPDDRYRAAYGDFGRCSIETMRPCMRLKYQAAFFSSGRITIASSGAGFCLFSASSTGHRAAIARAVYGHSRPREASASRVPQAHF
jgi:hypothetical protein